MKFNKINAVILSFFLSIIAASNTAYAGLITETQNQSVAGQDFTFSFNVSDWVLGSSSGLTLEVRGDFSQYNSTEGFRVTVEGVDFGTWTYQTSDSTILYTQDTATLFKTFDFSSIITDDLLNDDVLEFSVKFSYFVDVGYNQSSLVPHVKSTFVYNSVDVPEPSTLAIFALGMIALASRRFKKQ